MVKQLLSQGYTHPDARKKAQEIIDLGYGTVQDYELNKEPDFDSKTTPSQEELDAFAEYERIKAGGHLPKTDYNLDLTDSTEVRTKTMLDLLREESEESNA
jgi:predicted RNase H-like HicB family nuclease